MKDKIANFPSAKCHGKFLISKKGPDMNNVCSENSLLVFLQPISEVYK